MKYNFQKRSDDAGLSFEGTESMTRQEFASQCNINNILKKYVRNGVDPFVITAHAKYGDFTNVPSHQEALDLVIAAEDHFMQLSAAVRSRFDNDPGKLLDFLSDSNNRDEAIKLGLVQEKLTTSVENKSPATQVSSSGEAASKP